MEKGGENSYTFKHDGWNSTVPAGQSVSIGFSAELAEDTPLPEQFLLPVAVATTSDIEESPILTKSGNICIKNKLIL